MPSINRWINWRQHVALDVGTATTRIAFGPFRVSERPSSIEHTCALRGGVIVNEEMVSDIIEPFLSQARRCGILKPAVLACFPSDARKQEVQSLVDSIIHAGAASVSLIPEPFAAAVGSGLDVSSPYAQMVIDIGEGVTDCAIIRSSNILASCAIRTGCGTMRQRITSMAAEYGRNKISDTYADNLMRTIGLECTAGNADALFSATVVQAVLKELSETIESFILDISHDVASEIIDSGICLTGGGALIPGCRDYFQQRIGIDITTARNPRASVVEGACAILPFVSLFKRLR